jgi:photosystem II stability/assembly factor-like uncharacterized protein
MAADFTICVGLVGGGVFYSRDGGDRWHMARFSMPVPPWAPWCRVRYIDVAPDDDNHMLAASDVGIYRSIDKGASWTHVPSPADDGYIHVWCVKFHPHDSNTIFMGLAPGAIWKSSDNGRTWRDTGAPVEPRCVVGSTHITDVIFDPRDPAIVWATVEASGILRSADGGDSWVHLPPPGPTIQNNDIHGMVALPSAKIIASTPNGVWTSTDEGQTYRLREFEIDWPPEPDAVAVGVKTYCRMMTRKTDDPNTILVGVGDYVPGQVGGVRITSDGGETWRNATMDVTPNSVVYTFATHPSAPNRIVAASNYGYVYVSENAGEHWTKIKREFGEIRGLAWVPN